MNRSVALKWPALHGVGQIARFNWTFYVGGSLAAAAGVALARWAPASWVSAVLLFGSGLAVYWMTASLAVSHWVYDRSRLCRWDWIAAALDEAPRKWVNIHSGLDESSAALRKLFPGSAGRVFDMFDAKVMTEPSIARARRENAGDERVNFRNLPLRPESVDAALLLLSAHELRRPEERRTLLSQLRRALTPGARIVLAEHLRDGWNFAAFGPGFVHFHSRRAWLADIDATGLGVVNEFSITPFVRVFVLERRTV